MSDTYHKVIDPRVNIKSSASNVHVVRMGGSRVTEQVETADSSQVGQVNPTNASWSIFPPSNSTVVDRYCRAKFYWQVVGDQDLDVGSTEAPRQFPMHSCIETLTVRINGESISDNIGDKVHALLAFGNCPEDRNKSWSMSPVMPDQYQTYADYLTPPGGSARNPLASYGENSSEMTRGGFPYEVVDAKTARYVTVEGLLLSPFYSGLGNQEEGFVNINQLDIQMRFKSDMSLFWSTDATRATNPQTAISVSFYQAPEMLMTYITPDLTQQMPPIQVLDYHKQLDYVKPVGEIKAGATNNNIQLDTIRLSQIPDRVYLFGQRQKQDRNFGTSDAWLRINSVNVLWNNQSGLLSNADSSQLYEISVRNGLNMSYTQWSEKRGSVLCINFGGDLALLDNQAPGVVGQYTIRITVDATNVSGEDQTFEFYQLYQLKGEFEIGEDVARATLGGLTPSDVIEAKMSPEIHYDDWAELQGGSFFNKVKHFLKKHSNTFKGIGKALLPVARAAAQSQGYGTEFAAGEALTRGAMKSRKRGGRLVGGGLR